MKDAGHYYDRITLLTHRQVQAGDGTGAVVDEWGDPRRVWCRIEEPTGADRAYYGGLQTAIDAVIRVRGNLSIRTVDRFQDDAGNLWVINGISLDQYDQVCRCVRLNAGVV